jgi:hypothetical protein
VGLDVVLATITVKNCKLAADASPNDRRDARPPAQPYVAAGQASPAPTDWSPWPDTNCLGLQIRVSTTSAGFGTVPFYQAQVVGERYFSGPIGNAATTFVIDGPIQVTQADANGFTARMLLPTGTTIGQGSPISLNPDWILSSAALREELMGKLAWVVSWVGVES